MDQDPTWKTANATVVSKTIASRTADSATTTRQKPLNLLDLPIDILKEIVDHVSLNI
jgi:hypothetical protein